ncbi:MAG: S9 family peptidase [Candidatus Bathyarchaeota archaeon]|nr:S9 family peptidase [Candidatus Bathyarchaeota archaeon]
MADLKPVEITDLAKITAVSAPQISPDGNRVVFVHSTMDMEEDEYYRDLWMADLQTGKAYQYTSGRRKDQNPQWSPDGSSILFTSTPPTKEDEEKKKPQVYVIDVAGGEARQVTDIEAGVDSPKWSPNGKKILFLSNVKREERESDVKVITRLSYKFNARGFYENLRKHIFTVPANGGKATQVTEGEFDVAIPEWTSNSRAVIFSSNLEEDADLVRRSYLYKVDAKGGEPEQLTNVLMNISGIKVKPGGKEIAFTGHDYHNGSGTNSDVWVMKEGKEPKNLTSDFDQELGTKLSSDIRVSSPGTIPAWSGDFLYFNSCYEGATRLYRVNWKGGKVKKVLGGIDHSVESFTVNQEGKIAYTVLDTTKPIELWKRDGKKSKRVTNLNKDYVKKTDIQGHEQFTFTSNAGHSVEGWLMKPPGFDSSKKYPLILHIHGGPRGAYGNSFIHEFQVLAAQDWAVMYINPWGSGGYYEDYQAELPGHYHEQDYDDLMKAVDVIIERNPWVDPERLGVTGGSYGGVMTNWIITQTDRFAAAVTLRSITNWVSFYGVSDIGWTFGKTEIGGNWWEMEDVFMEKSPIRHVANVKTPTMIIHSEEDYRCPMEQAEQLFTALKVLGVETEFIRFPGENHELSRSGKPKHRKERLEHIIRWFKKYLD